ncbi:MAG: gamma-glutamylcyclotransferase [Burkholderiaceae bacterium]
MSEQHDPYLYHPELKGRIADPFASRFRQMDMALIDQKMLEAGAGPDWRRTDEARELSRVQTLRDRLDESLWVFGYGSLVWDPGFVFDQVRIGRLDGYQRSFCLRSEIGRGCAEKPGLMLGLDAGGFCESLVFRIPADVLEQETRLIWQREMMRHTYAPTFVPVQTSAGTVQALTFIVDPVADNYIGNIAPAQAARFVATGAGLYGTCYDYVDNLARHLEAVGIHDPAVSSLREQARKLMVDNPGSG